MSRVRPPPPPSEETPIGPSVLPRVDYAADLEAWARGEAETLGQAQTADLTRLAFYAGARAVSNRARAKIRDEWSSESNPERRKLLVWLASFIAQV